MNARLRQILFRPPTIRMLVVAWAATVLLAWATLVGGWFTAKSRLTRIGNHVATNIQAMDATHKLEAAILAYRHDDLLWHATEQGAYQAGEEQYLQEAQDIADSFGPYIDTLKERELLATIREKLGILRSQLALVAPTPTEVEVGSAFDLLSTVHDLEVQNENQMTASIQEAERVQDEVSDWAVGFSVGTAVLLFAGALGLMRRIIRPTLALTEAAESFGQGDFSAQAGVLHDDELGILARTFNNMARDIADREKDRLQFVAMVVHDLKNPMLAIELATRMLLGPGVTEEQRRSYTNGIKEETARVRGIIRDLTDDIQVVNGRFSIRKTEVDLGVLIRRFVETQRRTFPTHDIVVWTDEGCIVDADANRIERVLTNLVSNAVKYSPPNTPVTIRVEKADEQVLLTVSDQGPGIAPEDLKVLFQPFGRGRFAGALAEGTGMGLYVVQQIVKAHSGSIHVHSDLGHGATFEIRLPAGARHTQPRSSLTNSPAHGIV